MVVLLAAGGPDYGEGAPTIMKFNNFCECLLSVKNNITTQQPTILILIPVVNLDP